MKSAQAAGRGVKQMRNLGDVTAPGESVVREFRKRAFDFDGTLKQVFERDRRTLLRRLTGGVAIEGFLNVELPKAHSECVVRGQKSAQRMRCARSKKPVC